MSYICRHGCSCSFQDKQYRALHEKIKHGFGSFHFSGGLVWVCEKCFDSGSGDCDLVFILGENPNLHCLGCGEVGVESCRVKFVRGFNEWVKI